MIDLIGGYVNEKPEEIKQQIVQISFRATESVRDDFVILARKRGSNAQKVLEGFVSDYVDTAKPKPIAGKNEKLISIPKHLIPAVAAFVAWMQSDRVLNPDSRDEAIIRDLILNVLGVAIPPAASQKENGA
jgi:hypothetical protein